MPISHGEGRFVCPPELLRRLAEAGQDLKESRLDIAVVDEQGRHLNIELQRENHKHFIPRGLFYLDKLFIEPLGGGEDYGKLKPMVWLPPSPIGFSATTV